MPAYRFYYEGSLSSGECVSITGKEHHHLVHVMRRKVRDSVEVVNGQGQLAFGMIESINRHEAVLNLDKVQREAPSEHHLILAQAIPKMNRLDAILEKGTELGMTELWLFPGETSEIKKLTASALEKMKGVTVSAMKQCGRLYLPNIVTMPRLSQWKNIKGDLFFGDLDPSAPPLMKALKSEQKERVFIVGPESGFTDNETAALKTMSAQGVKLHKNILRADTAAFVAVALIHHFQI